MASRKSRNGKSARARNRSQPTDDAPNRKDADLQQTGVEGTTNGARQGGKVEQRSARKDGGGGSTERVSSGGDKRLVSSSESAQQHVDIFGNRHPAVASDVIDCYNCGRPVAAGRFAPHLHKCMGKGRQASRQASLAWKAMIGVRNSTGDRGVKEKPTSRKRASPSTGAPVSKPPGVKPATKKKGKNDVSSRHQSKKTKSSAGPFQDTFRKTVSELSLPAVSKVEPECQSDEVLLRLCTPLGISTCSALEPERDLGKEMLQQGATSPADVQFNSGIKRLCLSIDPAVNIPNSQVEHCSFSLKPCAAQDPVFIANSPDSTCTERVEALTPPLCDSSTTSSEMCRDLTSASSSPEKHRLDGCWAPQRTRAGLVHTELGDTSPKSGNCLRATVSTRCGRVGHCDSLCLDQPELRA